MDSRLDIINTKQYIFETSSKQGQIEALQSSLNQCRSLSNSQNYLLDSIRRKATLYHSQLVTATSRVETAREDKRRISTQATRAEQTLARERFVNQQLIDRVRRIARRQIDSVGAVIKKAIHQRDSIAQGLEQARVRIKNYEDLDKKRDTCYKALAEAQRLEMEAVRRTTGIFSKYVFSKGEREDKFDAAQARYRVAEGCGLLPLGYSDKHRQEANQFL